MPKDGTEIIQRGRISTLLHANLAEHIEQRQEVVINELISAYRDKKLSNSPELMIGRIAELSTLKALLSQLEREARQGEDEAEKEVSRPAQ